MPLGLACQRSSFLLWDTESGRPLTPLISWQDRRAAGWVERNSDFRDRFKSLTGLEMTPHYAGPKLATMIEADTALHALLAAGTAVFGTLDVWIGRHLGAPRTTDVSMAARTGLVDLESMDWNDEILERLHIPRACLPHLRSSTRVEAGASGWFRLAATLADQACAWRAAREIDANAAVVNLGTGGFVLAPASCDRREAAYLTAALGDSAGLAHPCAIEGTINTVGSAVSQEGAASYDWSAEDPLPGAFAMPEMSGIGSPYWCDWSGPQFSRAARRADDVERRRILLEGVLFRIAGILADIASDVPTIVLAGGVSRDPAVAAGLASVTGKPVVVPEDTEVTLRAAAECALGAAGSIFAPTADASRYCEPVETSYLPAKAAQWRRWAESRLDA